MFKLIFIKILLFSYCFCEISVEKKEKLLNGLIHICNNLPDRQFTCDEGFIKDAQELDGNIYNVEANIRAENKLLRCKAALQDSDNEVISLVNNDLHCEEINDSVNHEQPLESQGQNPVPQDQNTEQQAQNVESETQLPESGVQSSDLEAQNPEAQNSGPQTHITEPQAQNEPAVQNSEVDGQNPESDVQSLESPVSTPKPGRRNSVELDSEVQSDPGLTSGEQFIAVPRDHPTPCAGCASHVNVDAPGVADLASLGIQHLDFHDPNTKHDLDNIVQVERQVQVVNGVRYILTLAVHFNKCTVILTPTCSYTTACKISILVKPWAKLPSGAPYRAILSNNCTEIWHYGDDGEVLPDNNVPKGDIKVVQHTELQSQPKHEKHLTNEDIKSIEEQIIPNSYFDKPTGNTNEAIRVDDQDVSKEHVFKVQASKQTENSISGSEQRKPVTTSNLSQDKKKLIDDMLDFFQFSGFEPKSVIEPNSNTRNKRSYDNELQVLSIAEKYNSIKNSINNAKFLFEMAQNMVDYLNEMDMDIRNRELINVLTASEETDNEQHFLYIQANVIIPCSKSKCELQDGQPKICNGVIDITNKMLPQILNTFCYDENKQVEFKDKINQISPDDPVLQKLVREAVKQIEYESTSKNALQYNTILSANTQTQSGTITKISIMIDYMDCDKSVPLLMRSNCTVLEQLGHKICEVIVHERHWLKERKISYSCTDRPNDMRMSKLNKNISVDDPKILEMIQEAIQILEIQSNKNNKQKLVGVTSISSQVIAGLLVNIEFTVGYTDCTSNMVRMDLKSCNIMKTQRLRQCKAQIWDRSWIIDGRQVDVSCDDDHENKKNMPEKTSITAFSEQDKEKPKYQERSKRQTDFAGGEVNKDIEDQKYKSLAEESLRQHVKEKGISEPLTVLKVTKVTTQVVAGTLTRIYFETSNNMECNSKIWERAWENFKEITVSCKKHQERSKRDKLVGGEVNKDIEDQKYKSLAEESLRQHVKEKGISEPLTVLKVTKVTTQVVAGTLTRIYFETSNNMECNSKIWEKPWENFKDITVSCEKHQERSKRQTDFAGGEVNKDIEDQKYKSLAEESLRQHVKEKGISEPLTVLKVTKVTTQVVAGTLTRIYFETSNNMECNSKIWEKPWENFKDITVSCEKHQERSKRQTDFAGGEVNKDIEDQKYKSLAEESLRQHVKEKGISEPLTVLKVTKVTTQVVSGTLTRIYFETSNNMECNSKIWEKAWENFKEITVSCKKHQERSKRDKLVGGEVNKDIEDQKYKSLAEESLRQHVKKKGISEPLTVLKVTKVTTQVVAGTLTRIYFETSNNMECNSKIWEKPWENFKDITVSCEKHQERSKRQTDFAGGEVNKDIEDQKYKSLAEESLRQHVKEKGISDPLTVLKVTKVTTQVVAGSLTRIYFETSNNMECNSRIWEKPWENFKEITVSCEKHQERSKRQTDFAGGEVNKDIEDQKYKSLAEESLRQHVKEKGISEPLTVLKVTKVTTQVVAGSLTRIYFETSNNMECNSKIWEKPWENFKEITVSCEKHQERSKRDKLVGGEVNKDIEDQKYKSLAEESLRQHVKEKGISEPLTVLKVTKVTTQVVAGSLTRIYFETSNNMECNSRIWEKPWENFKEITVSCEKHQERSKRDILVGGEVNKDIEDQKYKSLAEESLRQHVKEKGISEPLTVLKVTKVTTQVVAGSLTRIYFETSNNMECNSKIWEKPWENFKEITVSCDYPQERFKRHIYSSDQVNQNADELNNDKKTKVRREVGNEDDDLDEDLTYYYADRAVQYINDHVRSSNLHKLVTIHAVQTAEQMRTTIVRMYIEVAETYCMRNRVSKSEINNCDEMEGINHRLCFARLYPEPEDELVLKHVTVICNDDDGFDTITGISIPELLRMSILYVEREKGQKYKLVHQGEPQVIPSLDSNVPIQIDFILATTNCSKDVNLDKNPFQCFLDTTIPSKSCHSFIWLVAETKTILWISVNCSSTASTGRQRRSSDKGNEINDDTLEIQKLVTAALQKLEMSSMHRYKQRVLQINSHSTKITTGKVTTIDFDVGYTSCLKYEWVDNIATCDFLEHLPRRHCVAQIWERLWLDNGRNIDVSCVDDETPLEAHIEFESAEMATQLADRALKHIEAKYPHPQKQKIVRIFSLEKQVVAGIHYRMKVEVGYTDCMALSDQKDCKLLEQYMNKFCRVNVWVRPWTDHPANFRVTCDYQESTTSDLYHQIQAEHLFYAFVSTYNPSYANDYIEMQKRFEIFKNNIKRIQDLNTHERGTASYGVTRFADLTYEEFSTKYLGLKPSLRDENQVPMKKADIPNIAIPDSFDWRDFQAVTEVKNQGSCGSCWAFSVTGNIEGQWKMQSGQLVSLSEQELVDCDKLDSGCNGGLPDNAYRAIEALGGLETETDYPYEGEDDKCVFNKTLSRVKISGAVNITSNETGMAQWLVHNGPISIGINANAMQFYMGGISHPWKMLCNSSNLDHGVLIVGYGIKNYPLFNKKLPYWIIKNSWGKSWGEQGYYRVFRGDGTCGVNQMASSAII